MNSSQLLDDGRVFAYAFANDFAIGIIRKFTHIDGIKRTDVNIDK